jgi:hypothetical protein
MNSISCKQFTDYLIRRAEHFDTDIIRDVTPTQGWVGHVSTGMFPPGDGVTRQWDRFHRVQPDMSDAWSDVTAADCTGTPCDPDETEIGFGYTQEEYTLQQKSYKTQLFCFDLILSADRAKEQFAHLVNILREATSIIISDRHRCEAFRNAGTRVATWAGGVALPTLDPYVETGNLITLVPANIPTSILTIEMLQRFVQPLILEGYGGSNPLPNQMFEYVTDLETAWNLREGNATLTNSYRFTDFAQGGKLYKYGITDAIGNFGLRIDPTPLRFLESEGTLYRVFPYENQAAAGGYGNAGIQGVVNDDYVNAPYQIDFIWHRMAMRSLVRDPMQINPMMPFAQRDFGGRWQFVMDNLGADAQGCVIENKRRNKGLFLADFVMATKPERPEWVVAIMHDRQRSCVTEDTPCAGFVPASYSAQNYSSANDACETTLTITKGAGAYAITIPASTILCNGYNVAHPDSGALANFAAVLAWVQANLSELGTWGDADPDLTLTGAVCQTVSIPAFEA